jgi:putative transcriptional regulator
VAVYLTRGFHRFARKAWISAADLRYAIDCARRGLIGADLGGGLIKQWIARPGQGKSGGQDRGGVMTIATKPSRLRREILELAEAKHVNGTLSPTDYRKITLREFRQPEAPQITGEDIRALRERAQVSQAVFGKYLRISTGYVQKLERGAKRPDGPVLVLLDLIRRKGWGAIL